MINLLLIKLSPISLDGWINSARGNIRVWDSACYSSCLWLTSHIARSLDGGPGCVLRIIFWDWIAWLDLQQVYWRLLGSSRGQQVHSTQDERDHCPWMYTTYRSPAASWPNHWNRADLLGQLHPRYEFRGDLGGTLRRRMDKWFLSDQKTHPICLI